MKLKFVLIVMIVTVMIGLAGMAGVRSTVYAQNAPASVSEGVYTEEQAKRAEPLFAEYCAVCHGEKLEGSAIAPPLAGPDFDANWKTRTAADLFDTITLSMPAENPGALTPEQTVDIIALILRSDKFPAGKAELEAKPDVLRLIRLEAPKP